MRSYILPNLKFKHCKNENSINDKITQIKINFKNKRN